MPKYTKPVVGGLLCGLIGLVFPQTLFFGYETLNPLLGNTSLSTTVLVSLLGAKIVSTAIAAGSGLVGGTFAPSLFLGAMVGASFHNFLDFLLQFSASHGGSVGASMMQLADVPAYAMVGAACLLASLFRAPLTATLLLFELTRDYNVILPLMASAGIGSLVADIIEAKVEQERVLQLRRDRDTVSFGNLSDKREEEEEVVEVE
jgi:H+/Cl- antiporter ClcA